MKRTHAHVRGVVQRAGTTLAVMDDELEQLLADHRALALERDAAEAGSNERAALDEELLAVQRRIVFWSDDDNEDAEERGAG